ncbi:DNA repair helicase [Serendipita vermifera]|nr:DNA repair helicase [Serendipita vermifera]
MALTLPTPEEFNIFPYDPPYSIQRDLMRHLFTAIEGEQFAIMESPTGTGKTLSLLSGAITWLLDEKTRSEKGRFAQLEENYKSENAPAWIVKQSIEFARQRLRLEQEDFQIRLDKARKHELSMRMEKEGRERKRRRLLAEDTKEDNSEDDEHSFLPEDAEDSNLSLEVKELMRRLEQAGRNDLADPDKDGPASSKVFYASRTHSQLSQLHIEYEKLKKQDGDSPDRPITRVVPLGSRKNLCINEALRSKGGDLDEGCRELMNEKGKKRCPFLPPAGEDIPMQELRDRILATPRDIEDLAQLGREMKTCPYYGSRRAIRQAELVVLPYNLLLQEQSREALGLDLTGQVVIIDEAHNLIDTILSIHTVSLGSSILKRALDQLRVYLQRFRKMLSPQNLLHLRRLVEFLVALDKYCDELEVNTKAGQSNGEVMMTPGELLAALGKKVQGVNLLEIESYLRSSKVARKISGYNDKVTAKEARDSGIKAQASTTTPPLHIVQNFIITLVNANEDGKVIITVPQSRGSASSGVSLKYQLLNPSRVFQPIVQNARSVILAGGTMAPMSDFRSQLVPYLPEEKLAFFSCGHVIPQENLLTTIVPKGPSGKPLIYKQQQQKDPAVMTELGQILFNLVNVVPDGLVVFFPSYSFLFTLRSHWKESGLLDRLGQKKTIFFEPHEGGSVDTILRDYSSAIREKVTKRSLCSRGADHQPKQPDSKTTGAVMLAVVGAKLSEGLNFSDDLARAVVVVGLPFANIGSVELKERMRYVKALDKKSTSTSNTLTSSRDAGMELYENLCMKAVNQSIGRAIRHKNDWAALILLDERYGTARVKNKLPKWIGDGVKSADTFGQVIKELGQFYRSRKSGISQ